MVQDRNASATIQSGSRIIVRIHLYTNSQDMDGEMELETVATFDQLTEAKLVSIIS